LVMVLKKDLVRQEAT